LKRRKGGKAIKLTWRLYQLTREGKVIIRRGGDVIIVKSWRKSENRIVGMT